MENGRKDAEWHIPVLTNEVSRFIITDPEGIYIDGTVGGGGHASAIISRLQGDALYLGLDRDPAAVMRSKSRLSDLSIRVRIMHSNYREMDSALIKAGFDQADGILLDLGVSSGQIDTQTRGFSYTGDGPLDMRMDQETGVTARELINELDEGELADLIFKYGEERYGRKIARAIIRAKENSPINTTAELSGVIRSVTRGQKPVKTLARVFQAFRIAVNEELDSLQAGLKVSKEILRSGGRLVVLSYHSLEDRIVKEFLKTASSECICPSELPVCVCDHTPELTILTRRVVKPTSDEIKANPRARSARLRAAEKI